MAITETAPPDITAPLTAEQARELTDEVRRDVAHLWMKVLTLYEGSAHAALDYPSWRAYWEAEFGGDGTRGDQYIRAGRVCRVLARAELPLPANDAVARALGPVMRKAPDELPALWRRALEESGGKPTGVQVKKLAEPFIDRRPPKVERTADGRSIRRLRHAVGGPLYQTDKALEAVEAALEAALRTSPPDTMVRDWIRSATRSRHRLDRIIETLK